MTKNQAIRDSGERTVFKDKDGKPAAMRDIQEGKTNYLLLPFSVMGDICNDDIYNLLNTMFVGLSEDKSVEEKSSTVRQIATSMIFSLKKLLGWNDAVLAEELAIHFQEGAQKYAAFNWQKGMPWSNYLQSFLRHYHSWKAYAIETGQHFPDGECIPGYKYEPNPDDEHHERAMLWNLVCLIWTAENHAEFCNLTPEVFGHYD